MYIVNYGFVPDTVLDSGNITINKRAKKSLPQKA